MVLGYGDPLPLFPEVRGVGALLPRPIKQSATGTLVQDTDPFVIIDHPELGPGRLLRTNGLFSAVAGSSNMIVLDRLDIFTAGVPDVGTENRLLNLVASASGLPPEE